MNTHDHVPTSQFIKEFFEERGIKIDLTLKSVTVEMLTTMFADNPYGVKKLQRYNKYQGRFFLSEDERSVYVEYMMPDGFRAFTEVNMDFSMMHSGGWRLAIIHEFEGDPTVLICYKAIPHMGTGERAANTPNNRKIFAKMSDAFTFTNL